MNEIITLITDYKVTDIIIIFGLLFIIVKTLVSNIGLVREWLNNWHNKKNKEEETQETFEERISKLESHDQTQYDKLIELTDGIKELKDLILNMKKDNDEFVVVTCRSQLYRIHQEATAQGYITRECLKTFSETGKKYEASGGDDIYHDKLHPEVMALPIRD